MRRLIRSGLVVALPLALLTIVLTTTATRTQAIACVETTLGDSHGMYVVPLLLQGTFRTAAGGRADSYVAGQEVQFYADGDTDVIFEIARNSARGTGNATVTLAGYYVDMP
jgi:hypothetical protein